MNNLLIAKTRSASNPAIYRRYKSRASGNLARLVWMKPSFQGIQNLLLNGMNETEKARGLSDIPRGFPLVPRYEHLGIRRRPHGNYAIFYRRDAKRIIVIHILHGARDYEAMLFPVD